MKTALTLALIVLLLAFAPAPAHASAASFFAHFPQAALATVRIVTDGGEYITGKIHDGFSWLDYYADLGEAKVLVPSPANVAHTQRRKAKAAAKAAARTAHRK